MIGVDISKHQADNTVAQLGAAGIVQYIITRTAIGSYTVDAKFNLFMKDIAKYNLNNSFYVASYAKDVADAIAEADFVCKLAKESGNEPELPIFFDWEYFSRDYIKKQFGITATPALVQCITAAFCERVKEHGYLAGVYANKDFYDRFYTKAWFDAHPDYWFWYARPGYAAPDKECDIWQYASNEGAEFGYSGIIDKNIMYTDFTGTVDLQPMKPISSQPIRLKIGFASAGDIQTLKVKIEGLGIACVVADGYIITSEVSTGDQCYILTDCNNLGIPCVEYKETKPEPKPEPTPEPEKPEPPTEEPKEDNKPKEDKPQEKPAKKKSIFELIIDFIFALFEGK